MAQVAAFQAALQRIGFPQDAIASLSTNGITTSEDLVNLEEKDIEQVVKIIRTGPPPVAVPYLAQRRLKTFSFWATRRRRLNESTAAHLFTNQALEAFTVMMAVADKDDDSAVKSPGEFKKDTKWKAFKEGMIAYLNALKGKHNIPLAYVIRELEAPQLQQQYQSEHHRLIEIAPLHGIEYEEDNGRVFDILKSLLINGPAWTWMRAFNNTRNGRQAWLALVTHFEGDAQRDRVKDQAYAAIAAAKYYGEKKRFSFETYVTIHQDSYADLEQYGEIVSEEKKVRDLLTGIKDNTPATNAAKGTILATPNLRTSFTNAVAHLATTLQLSQSTSQDTRNVSSTHISGKNASNSGRGSRGGRGGGRGRGRGKGRGRNIYLGSYSPDQWYSLSTEDKKKVIEGRAKSAAASQSPSTQNRSQGANASNAGRNLSAVGVDQEDFSQLTGPNTAEVDRSMLQGTLQGSAASGDKRSPAESAGSHMSRRRLASLTSSMRGYNRNISQVKYKQIVDYSETVSGFCELDSHADTCVAGANCVVLEVTHHTVNVSAFSNAHKTMKDVPIVTAATAYDNPSTGDTYILILGQSIYMGDQMENSLICPNQLRFNGLIVDECPKHLAPPNNPSSHSIYCPPDGMQIPLILRGITSGFQTRTPTKLEIDTCKWVHLTDDQYWDPHSSEHQEHEEACIAHQHHEHHPRNICSVSSYLQQLKEKALDTVVGDVFPELNDWHIIAATSSSTRSCDVDIDNLANSWNIGRETAMKTLKCTTQKGIRTTLHPIERRFRTKQAQLRYRQLSGRHGTFYTDTFFASTPTLNGNSMAQLYINDLSFCKVYPMKHKSNVADTLSTFIHDVGIPNKLHSDAAKEVMQGKFNQVCRDYGIPCSFTEPYSPWQNRAEGGIRELKRRVHRKMVQKQVPLRLWDFCCKWACETHNKTASSLYALEERTPYESVMGNTPDISSLLGFDFYSPIWYFEQTASFPEPKRIMGRWIGEAQEFGQAMCYWILSGNATPIVRSTVQPISKDQLQTDEVRAQLKALDQRIVEKCGKPSNEDSWHKYDINNVDGHEAPVPEHVTPEYEPYEPESSQMEADDWEPEAYDKFISAEVRLFKGGQEHLGTVVSRKRDAHGNPVGRSHPNPILDTRVYQVTFPDGDAAEYSANVIAESLYSQVDADGRQYSLLDDIVDWKMLDNAIEKHNIFQVSHNGNIHKRRTTKGWKFCILWKDGSTSWENLKDLKEVYPVQLAEYVIKNGLSDYPAFQWWVPETIKRKDRMIKAIKTRYQKRTHKYGLRLPKSVEEAYAIDAETGADYWHNAILKEMQNNAVAFKFLEDGDHLPVGSKWIPFHMIFDIKCDFTRKARFVAGGHWTEAPAQITYSSVVTRESVRIGFLIAALNGLDILAADVGNAYLQAPTREKVHTTAGPEFGPSNVGRTVIIVRAMYGLKSSGAAWHAKLGETLREMGFKPSYADPDVWMKPATKSDGFKYYDYILVYVDDILVISALPNPIMQTIQQAYRLKEAPQPPKTYLGATIKPWNLPGELKPVWSMNCVQYLKEAIKNVESELLKTGKVLRGKPSTPMQTNYRPELDVTSILGPEQANYFQSLIGILRWAVELGRIDIYIDVAMLSSHLAQPRVGHLDQVLHIFSYLKHHINSHLVFDPNYVSWSTADFSEFDWTEFYYEAKEAKPPNAPEPRGHVVQMNAFVDADHAGNRVTRRSQTGILIYLNCSPILWYSKAQNTVESSTFGSEFIAMRILVDMIESLRYKLRMFGIPIDGAANVFCDNNSVVINASIPTSTLKKKHNAIAYHRVREAVAAGLLRIAKVQSCENLADLLTKSLSGSALRNLIQKILW